MNIEDILPETEIQVVSKAERRDFISKHILSLMLCEPFWAHIVRTLTIIEDAKQVPTAGVRATRPDYNIEMVFNYDFVSKLNPHQIRGLLKHEAMHIVFQHITERKYEPHIIHNIAADLAINCNIPKNELPPGGFYPGRAMRFVDENFNEIPIYRMKDKNVREMNQKLSDLIQSLPTKESTEYYYSRLMEDQELIEQMKQMFGNGNEIEIEIEIDMSSGSSDDSNDGGDDGDNGDGNGHGDGDGTTGSDDGNGNGEGNGDGSGKGTKKIKVRLGMDNHSDWSEDMSEEERQVVQAKAKSILEEAVRQADRSNQWGSVSSDMRTEIRKILENTINWQALLRQFVGQTRRADRRTSWRKINKRIPGLTPASRRNYTSTIAVYVDQSGSVDDESLERVFGELYHLSKKSEFYLYHFDCTVDEDSELLWKKGRNLASHRTRGGGTNFDAPTEHANKNANRFDGYIIITDGIAPKPKHSKLKRGWILIPGTKLEFTKDSRDVEMNMKKELKKPS